MDRHDHSRDSVEAFLTDLGQAPVPPDLVPAVAARVREERQVRSRGRSALSALFAAASLVVVVVAAVLMVRASLVSEPSPGASGAPGASPRAKAPPPTPPPAATSPTPGASPAASLRNIRLTCGDSRGAAFSAAALSGPAGAEDGTGGAAAALRAFLADPAANHNWPRAGWRELVATSQLVLYAAPEPGADQPGWLVFAKAERADSGWTVLEYGHCRPQVILGAGIGRASWELGQRVNRTTREFTVLVQEQACASGRSPAGRIVPPRIVVDAHAVTITFGVRPLPGGQDCQGGPPAPYRVRLPQPLGDRELRDGGVFPPLIVRR
jgi:hypothetical protein